MMRRQIHGVFRIKLCQLVRLPRVPVLRPILAGLVNDCRHILIELRLRLHKRLPNTSILRVTSGWMSVLTRLLLAASPALELLGVPPLHRLSSLPTSRNSVKAGRGKNHHYDRNFLRTLVKPYHRFWLGDPGGHLPWVKRSPAPRKEKLAPNP